MCSLAILVHGLVAALQDRHGDRVKRHVIGLPVFVNRPAIRTARFSQSIMGHVRSVTTRTAPLPFLILEGSGQWWGQAKAVVLEVLTPR